MTTILYRTLAAQLEVRDDDGRTLHGTLVPYGTQTRIGGYTESFMLGAFADADPERVPLFAPHPDRDRPSLPIGRAVHLHEEEAGAFRVSATPAGDAVLTLVRDGAVRGLSIGFIPLPGGDRWSQDRTRVERLRAHLAEVSVVPFPAYPDAQITAVRATVGSATPRLRLARLLRRAA
jgi:HK97 family phage prohead protease